MNNDGHVPLWLIELASIIQPKLNVITSLIVSCKR